ncbi:MAG: LexA family transcriptional regulator [Aliivibrio sp.]|uniref:LexA family protein n=1 Tax=Aliivibrio sp. TaxID=1872443 RepID=UPI001A49FF16|nr:LexA family transcriptional regulator [Aliivibrio sp.]
MLNRRKELGLTQADIAKAVGVSRVSVSLWEKGETTPKGIYISLLAKVLKCDVNWLLTGQGSPEPIEKEATIVPVALQPQGAYPLISWVQAGGWSDICLTDLHEADYYPCPIKCSKNTFILKVVGKSMNPVFTEGELIYVDPDADAENGKYVVARLDDENQATFKQLIIEDGHKYLQAVNPNWPTPIIPINGNCTIVGVVISSMRLF